MRHDLALQTAASRVEALASPSTLCRFEQRFDRQAAVALHHVLLDQFIQAHPRPPKRVVLDFDATDTPLHGEQEGRFFHGYYDRYCYLPLYVFGGHHLLVSDLRPSHIDAAKHRLAILSQLVKARRPHWPKVEIILRGESGFCRRRLLNGCDRQPVRYIVGIAKNARLQAADWLAEAKARYETRDHKQRLFASIQCGDQSAADRPIPV